MRTATYSADHDAARRRRSDRASCARPRTACCTCTAAGRASSTAWPTSSGRTAARSSTGAAAESVEHDEPGARRPPRRRHGRWPRRAAVVAVNDPRRAAGLLRRRRRGAVVGAVAARRVPVRMAHLDVALRPLPTAPLPEPARHRRAGLRHRAELRRRRCPAGGGGRSTSPATCDPARSTATTGRCSKPCSTSTSPAGATTSSTPATCRARWCAATTPGPRRAAPSARRPGRRRRRRRPGDRRRLGRTRRHARRTRRSVAANGPRGSPQRRCWNRCQRAPLPDDRRRRRLRGGPTTLVGLAYRMLGQPRRGRGHRRRRRRAVERADRSDVRQPEAWLVTATTRRALDVLRSARLQRVDYPGEWLPEPIATDGDPSIDVERRETLTMGFLRAARTADTARAGRVRAPRRARLSLRARRGRRRSLAGRMPAGRAPGATPRQRAGSTDDRRTPARPGGGRLGSSPSGSEAPSTRCSPRWRRTSSSRATAAGSSTPACARCAGASAPPRYLANLAARVGDDPLVVLCELNGEPGLVLHGDTGWVAMTAEIIDHRVAVLRMVVSPPKLERLIASLGAQAGGRPGPWDGPGHFRHRRGRPAATPTAF